MIVQNQLGSPDVLALTDAAVPTPGPTEVLVKVTAAGVNPVDWKTRATGGVLGSPPFTVGWDFSGQVVGTGAGVTRFAVGDAVMGMPRFPAQASAYSEFVVAPSRQLVLKPDNISYEEAAGLPMAALTAWQVLVDTARVTAGQRVLMPAAAGGVGHLAVQLAKYLGAYVIGTASAAKHEFVLSLGADEVIDYRTSDVAADVRDIDVVLATVPNQISALVRVLRPGGIIVALNGVDVGPVAEAADQGVRAVFQLVEPDRSNLQEIADLAERGILRVHIDGTFPLGEASKAHAFGESGRTTGKVVLVV
jgi:NADPH:quinone reductase-like Zn-dependent oxidoreductase